MPIGRLVRSGEAKRQHRRRVDETRDAGAACLLSEPVEWNGERMKWWRMGTFEMRRLVEA